MAFNDGPGFASQPGMYYPLYRFNITGGADESAWSAYFVVSNYSGSTIPNGDLLGAIKDAVAVIPGISTVQVTKYEQATTDVTASL